MLLLRHASAGVRLSSPGVDRFRRLDETGRATARNLIWALAGHELTIIVSSPIPRCVETVVPLSHDRGLRVDTRPQLEPDASEDELRALLLSLPDTTLACTHREGFEQLYGGEIQCEKGGAWILERHGAELVPTEYLAPPAIAGRTRQAVSSTA